MRSLDIDILPTT